MECVNFATSKVVPSVIASTTVKIAVTIQFIPMLDQLVIFVIWLTAPLAQPTASVRPVIRLVFFPVVLDSVLLVMLLTVLAAM